MTNRTLCDGTPRRDLLKIGLAGLFGSGLSLDGILRAENIAKAANDRGLSVIYVFLKGGLSTIDTLDMKPNAPAEFRGEFNPSATNVPGLQIADLLPKMATQMDKMALLRGFGHKNSDHGPADHYMLTALFSAGGFQSEPATEQPTAVAGLDHGENAGPAEGVRPRGQPRADVCLLAADAQQRWRGVSRRDLRAAEC